MFLNLLFPTPLQSPPSPELHTRHLIYPTGSQVSQLHIAKVMASDALNGVTAEDPSTNRPVSINSVHLRVLVGACLVCTAEILVKACGDIPCACEWIAGGRRRVLG